MMRFLKWSLPTLAFVILGSFGLGLPAQAGADPGGNNGFIKINGDEMKDNDGPNNEPHVGCKFLVEFYNYDKGNHYADVDFELQSPTKGAGYSLAVQSGDLTPFIGGDNAGGGNDLDANPEYKLAFTGVPQANQGYHVKVTIHADGSKGNDVKHKVFWVEPCAEPKKAQISARADACDERGHNQTGEVTVAVTNPNQNSVTYTVTIQNVQKQITLAGGASGQVTFQGLSAGDHHVVVTGSDKTTNDTCVKVETCPKDCTPPPVVPVNPTIAVQASACVNKGDTGGSISVTLTNANSTSVTYTVVIGAQTQVVSVAANTSKTVVFSGLAAGTYEVTANGNNQTSAKLADVIIAECEPGRGGVPPVTIPPVVTPPVQLPATLPQTGGSIPAPLLSLVAAITAYGIMYMRQRFAAEKSNQ